MFVRTEVITPNYYQSSWFQLIRPLTLTGTISPILVSTLFIYWHIGIFTFKPIALLLVATLLIQIATNIWNDYFDFKKGQDNEKWQSNIDGRHSPAHHQLPYVAIGLTIIAIIIGIWLSVMTTLWIIPIGMAGILGGFFYSAGSPSLSQIGFGELVAAIFLGLSTTILPFLVLGANLWSGLLLAIPFALLISSMILTNNIRDIEKDQPFRHTLPIKLGRNKAITVLKGMLFAIYGWLLFLMLLQVLPITILLVVANIPIALKLFRCFQDNLTNMACMKYAALHHWGVSGVLLLAIMIDI